MYAKNKAIEAGRLKKPTEEADVYAQENLVNEMEQFMVFAAFFDYSSDLIWQIKENEEESSEEGVPKIIHRPKIPDRKTRAQRNKEVR